MSSEKLQKLILASMLLALALVLPFMTGQLREIGNALCPMHLPVLICGFFCGPLYGMVVGFAAPLIRFAFFGMPVLIPSGISMAFELAAYGLAAGLLYKFLPKKKTYVYVSLIGAMLFGRIIWGIARAVFYGVGGYSFGWTAFVSGALINAVPGIIVQIIIIPIIVIALRKYTENG